MLVKDGKVMGVQVSEHGLLKKRLDYKALSELVGPMIFNGYVRDRTLPDWVQLHGEFKKTVMADYIISHEGAKFLQQHTDELLFYNPNLDVIVWATTHWGDDWSRMLSNVQLKVDNNADDR